MNRPVFEDFSLKTGLSLFIRISKRLNIAKSGYRLHPYEFQTIFGAKIITHYALQITHYKLRIKYYPTAFILIV